MNLLSQLLPIFVQTILPVFLVAVAGMIVSRLMDLDGKTIGRVLFYLATPALVFSSLYSMDLDRSVLGSVAMVSAGSMLSTTAIGWISAWNLERKQRAAIALTSGISNNGNMGLPINSFAFGPEALSLASVYYVISSIMTNTVGAVIASSGNVPVRQAILQIVKVPVVYAAVLGMLFNQLQISVPLPVFRAVDMLGAAAVPMMLVMLGVQLRNPDVLRRQPGVGRSAIVRLVIGPLVAWSLCMLLGVGGLERSVLITQAAMPTAVVVSVLATEYDVAPKLVVAVIVFTTLISILTLSLVLALVV